MKTSQKPLAAESNLSDAAIHNMMLIRKAVASQTITAAQTTTSCEEYLCFITSNIGSSKLLLEANLDTVMLVVPLPERCGVNLDDGVFHKCLCPDQLIVG